MPQGIEWEVIVVDNHSSDDSSAVAFASWKRYRCTAPFNVIAEPRPGLSFARKTGADAAQYELLLYCDDDNWLAPDYIRISFQQMQAHPNIGVLGGRSTACFEANEPAWFSRFEKAYAVGRPMQQSGNANQRTYLAGAGMLVRKSLLQQLEAIDYRQLLTDRKGKELSSGGDAELCLVMLYLGYDLYYDERLQFVHYMPAGRLDWRYCVKMMAEGHAIPQLYFELYQYCYEQRSATTNGAFLPLYRKMLAKHRRKLIRCFLPPGHGLLSLKLLVKGQEGSKKEIQVKAALHKLRWLYRNRVLLEAAFQDTWQFMGRLAELREAAPVHRLNQTQQP